MSLLRNGLDHIGYDHAMTHKVSGRNVSYACLIQVMLVVWRTQDRWERDSTTSHLTSHDHLLYSVDSIVIIITVQ